MCGNARVITNEDSVKAKIMNMQNNYVLIKALYTSVFEKCKVLVIPKSYRFSILLTIDVSDLLSFSKMTEIFKLL